MSRTHLLNVARNVFLEYARRRRCDRPCKAARAVELADAIEGALDLITILENAMRTKQQAIDAALAEARRLKQENTDLKAQLAAAPKPEDVITDAELQAANEIAPEPDQQA